MFKALALRNSQDETLYVSNSDTVVGIRVMETNSVIERTAFMALTYDQAEQLRDHLSEFLIENWPQDD